jgi:hypothetical protein
VLGSALLEGARADLARQHLLLVAVANPSCSIAAPGLHSSSRDRQDDDQQERLRPGAVRM